MNSEAHKAKMAHKAEVRDAIYNGRNFQWQNWKHGVPANINRHTGKSHEHKREIDRNLCRKGAALFKQDIAEIAAAKAKP